MKLDLSQQEDGTLKLSGTLDIYAAETLREGLTRQLRDQSRIALDLSEVDGCDVTGLQLLCSARNSSNGQFNTTAVPPPVLKTCAALGLTELFPIQKAPN